MNNQARVICFIFITAVLCASWVAAQPMVGNPKKGETIYHAYCLRCHGQTLEGNGPDAQHLIVPPANLRSLESRLKTDWELLFTISHGVLFTPMHGWRDRLSDQDMVDVLAYIRTAAPRGTIS